MGKVYAFPFSVWYKTNNGRIQRVHRGWPYEGICKVRVKEIKDIKMEHFAQCFKCHLPHAVKDGSDELARQLAKAFVDGDAATLKKVGINCIVCHNTKAIVHKWQDGEPVKGVIYGSKDGHILMRHKTMKKSVIKGEAVACGQCQGTGPNLEFLEPSQCGTAYGSYLHAYIPAGGTETCQDCHMKKMVKDTLCRHMATRI